jgi:hypothetical protein
MQQMMYHMREYDILIIQSHLVLTPDVDISLKEGFNQVDLGYVSF